MKTTTWSLDLGSGECETCGTNFDALTVSFYHDSGTFYIALAIGCYGGDSYEGTSLEAALEKLRDMADFYVFDVEAHPENAAELAAIIEDLPKVVDSGAA